MVSRVLELPKVPRVLNFKVLGFKGDKGNKGGKVLGFKGVSI